MSYRLPLSFKNCKPKNFYYTLDNFVRLIKENHTEIIRKNLPYFIYDLERVYDQTKDRWEVEGKIRDYLKSLFSYSIYYCKDIESLCVCWSDRVNNINNWFNGHVYFQDSCDQDYPYKEWNFNKYFRSVVSKIRYMSKEECIDYSKENKSILSYHEEFEDIDIDYYKRSAVYDECYKYIEPFWSDSIKIQIGEDMFGEYYTYSHETIRLLCGLDNSPIKDKSTISKWRDLFNLKENKAD